MCQSFESVTRAMVGPGSDASGASKISVFATQSLRADASGASRIRYAGGAADIEKKASGASSVSER